MDTHQQQPQNETQTRRAALGGLAVVGFIALILIGIGTAIYAASFLPKAFSKLGGANVYLSSLDNGNGGQTGSSNPNIPVSSQPGGSVPLSPATSTAPAATQPAPATPTTPAPKPATPTYTYTQPTQTTQTVVIPATQSYYGLPDLTVTVNSVGYLTRRNDTTSFVSATNIPNGYQGAVRFTVANRGTNVAGNWNFRADLPSDTNSTYTSAYQRALNPGDSVVFTLGFDSSRNGSGNVRITVDPYGSVNESNESNNTDSGTVYFQNYGYNNSGSYDSNGNYCSYGTYYSNGRYYCNSSYNSGSYDSNGNYCPNGTYYSGGRTYCNGYNNNYGNNNQYDSNGNYCSYGTYYSNGRYYCNGSSYNNTSGSYDSNGNYCSYGTYYSNGRYYCNDAYSRNNNTNQYDSNGNYCWAGSYYSNGRTYCY